MSVKVGIAGLGFMGKVHFDTYAKIKNAKVVAIAELDPCKRAGDWSSIAGNIGGAGQKTNLRGIKMYDSPAGLIEDPDVEVVDITLPTYMHAKWTVRALQSGRHVICEKPMALKSGDAAGMIRAAAKAKRRLFIAQCIRFWPAYSKACALVKAGAYGRVLSAVFTRVSPKPTWSWRDWLTVQNKSGGCALDLHIHDADFVLDMLGKPKSVFSRILKNPATGASEHITTLYQYPGNPLVQAEGAWEYNASFPFSMSFRIRLEKATLHFSGQDLVLCPARGGAKIVPTPAGDGYFHELRHFIDCITKNRASEIVPPESAMRSVRLIEAEMRSARSGKTARVN